MNLGEQSLDCSLVNPHTGAFQSSHIVSSLPLIFTSLLHPASSCLLPLPPQCLFAAPLDQSPSTLRRCRVSLPIKVVSSQQNLDKPQQLFNVDRTENKAGMLKHYTDIEVQTGTSRNQLRFFLSDLGEHKAILGYSWFAAVQPKINWKQGWIDSTQLPIILRAPVTILSPITNFPLFSTIYFALSVTCLSLVPSRAARTVTKSPDKSPDRPYD